MPDDFDAVVADRFTVLDDVPVPDTWSRVQFKVLDRMPVPFVEEDATMIDLETPHPDRRPPAGSKRVLVAVLLAAAAVVVVVVLTVRSSNDPDVIPPADTAVSSLTDLVVRPLGSPIECEPEVCPWSPELTAQALGAPRSPATARPSRPSAETWRCRPMARWLPSTRAAQSLTWYEDEPRVVPLTSSFGAASNTNLIAIGPHDIAYIAIGEVLRRRRSLRCGDHTSGLAHPTGPTPAFATATGLVNIGRGSSGRRRTTAPAMPWVDLDGNPITDTRPYPTATATDAGIEVRLGERKWLLADEPGIRPVRDGLLCPDPTAES